jgi:hypothetical protein
VFLFVKCCRKFDFSCFVAFFFVYKNECFWSGDVIFTQLKLILLGPPEPYSTSGENNKKKLILLVSLME